MNWKSVNEQTRVIYRGQTGTITHCFPGGIAYVQLDSGPTMTIPIGKLRLMNQHEH
jgi:hypothetical protein